MSDVTNIRSVELSRIAERIKYLRYIKQYNWLEIGRELSNAREELHSDQSFRQWCDEQNFGLKRDTLFKYRQAADFIDKNVGVSHAQHQPSE